MNKILLSLAIIGIVGGTAVGLTTAYFSDTETSTGNTFTAGTLDLKVWDSGENGGQGAWVDQATLANINELWGTQVNNLKPGDEGIFILPVKNAGTIDGYADFMIKNVINKDNGCTEPEGVIDNTCGPDDDGELGSAIDVTIGYDSDGDGDVDETFQGGNIDDIADINYIANTALIAGNTANWIIEVSIDSDNVGNEIQSDSVECDIEFSLNQEGPTPGGPGSPI